MIKKIAYICALTTSLYKPTYSMLLHAPRPLAAYVRLMHSTAQEPIDRSLMQRFYKSLHTQSMRDYFIRQATRLKFFATEDMFFEESPYMRLSEGHKETWEEYFTHLMNLPNVQAYMREYGLGSFERTCNTQPLFVSYASGTGTDVSFDALKFYDGYRHLPYAATKSFEKPLMHSLHGLEPTVAFIARMPENLLTCASSLEEL